MLLGQLREIAELNDVDVIGGDANTAAHHQREKSKLSYRGSVGNDTVASPT